MCGTTPPLIRAHGADAMHMQCRESMPRVNAVNHEFRQRVARMLSVFLLFYRSRLTCLVSGKCLVHFLYFPLDPHTAARDKGAGATRSGIRLKCAWSEQTEIRWRSML